MSWGWIAAIIIAVCAIIYFLLGYLIFLYLCLPNSKSGNLDDSRPRALNRYVPVIQEKAVLTAQKKHEMIQCDSFDGIKLRAKLFPNRRADQIIILLHGYQSSVSWDFGASFEWYYDAGFTILACEMRAHGSEGRYIGFGALDRKDVWAWMRWICDRYGADVRIAIAGVSMGAATTMLACATDSFPQLKCAIEDCGYSSLKKLLRYLFEKKKQHTSFLIPAASLWSKILAGYFFSEANPKAALRVSRVPILLIHGDADAFVPFYMLQELYDSCTAEKSMFTVHNAVHGESSYLDPDNYSRTAVSFLLAHME